MVARSLVVLLCAAAVDAHFPLADSAVGSDPASVCRQYFQARNWEQECVRAIIAANEDELQQHSARLPYGVMQSFFVHLVSYSC